MSIPDFWNLAGRAGRWGVEFQGNILCVDTDDDAWAEVPSVRVRQPITRATDAARSGFAQLVDYIEAGTPVSAARAQPELESLFGILAATRRRGAELRGLRWLNLEPEKVDELSRAVDGALQNVTVPPEVLQAHAGISPLSIQRLHDHFVDNAERLEAFQLAPPESDNALQSYINAIDIIDRMLGGGFTALPARQFSLALLFVAWMRGKPLSLLISSRLNYLRSAGRAFKLPAEIRQVLTDVEQYARFQGPLYLACYADVLAVVSPNDDGEQRPDIAMMMELGVSRTTELSMMSLGMSRTSAVALSEHIIEDHLDPEGCVAWIQTHDLEALGLPALVVLEIARALDGPRAVS
jgi:plasmid stabilization system protein ParE